MNVSGHAAEKFGKVGAIRYKAPISDGLSVRVYGWQTVFRRELNNETSVLIVLGAWRDDESIRTLTHNKGESVRIVQRFVLREQKFDSELLSDSSCNLCALSRLR